MVAAYTSLPHNWYKTGGLRSASRSAACHHYADESRACHCAEGRLELADDGRPLDVETGDDHKVLHVHDQHLRARTFNKLMLLARNTAIMSYATMTHATGWAGAISTSMKTLNMNVWR